MRNTWQVILLLIIATSLHAQTEKKHYPEISIYPEPGMPCPDFVINNLEYYPEKQVKVSDFRGKWLVLDFYDKNCGSCIAQFPRYNANQIQFADKVQFLLIGREDKENKIRSIYAKYRKQKNLLLPCAFDSAVFKKLDINSSPYAIIINPEGVVKYITTVFDTEELSDIIEGKKIVLRKAYREHETRSETYNYDRSIPFLIGGNGGNDTSYLFRSLLSKFDPLKQHSSCPASINYPQAWVDKYHIYRFEVLGVNINSLYRYAYLGKIGGASFRDSLYGKLWPANVLEIGDTSIFKITKRNVLVTGENFYCYSLSLPPAKYNRENLMSAMQRDLKNYFGFNAGFEIRKMPYWKLVATETAKLSLKTKGGVPFSTPYNHDYHDSVVIRNLPISFLITRVLPVNTSTMPFIDETGIYFNIDITLNYWGTPGLDVLREALRAKGLDLIRGEKEMKVLVIKEEALNE